MNIRYEKNEHASLSGFDVVWVFDGNEQIGVFSNYLTGDKNRWRSEKMHRSLPYACHHFDNREKAKQFASTR